MQILLPGRPEYTLNFAHFAMPPVDLGICLLSPFISAHNQNQGILIQSKIYLTHKVLFCMQKNVLNSVMFQHFCACLARNDIQMARGALVVIRQYTVESVLQDIWAAWLQKHLKFAQQRTCEYSYQLELSFFIQALLY